MTIRWAIKWHSRIVWARGMPCLFFTRKEVRKQLELDYGYIKTRKYLRKPPFNWRMPKAVKVSVVLKELK